MCALRTYLPELDTALQGGIPHGSITELVGRSGNGKTQMCLTLTTHACVTTPCKWAPRGLGVRVSFCSPCPFTAADTGQFGCVVYFDTENKFSAARLTEIACTRFPEVRAPVAGQPSCTFIGGVSLCVHSRAGV